jgi:hypothetical protein
MILLFLLTTLTILIRLEGLVETTQEDGGKLCHRMKRQMAGAIGKTDSLTRFDCGSPQDQRPILEASTPSASLSINCCFARFKTAIVNLEVVVFAFLL